ncbi:hypothetical protein [Saccharomonospora glauca]|jgi:hypothetical protein|uniref:Uncharacterized protein n=1 Tax=Saccharomonospora glauca K62 TaxID=928724 RepID=I1D5S2_9PSEU|nr:hypothetical protein [Saccharomonospora glauca]EIF00297.1 hypothetical protein SacglDRAFT_03436 [Saccharomonospora glauca K62]
MSVGPSGPGYPQESQQPSMQPMPPAPMASAPLPASPTAGEIHSMGRERPGTLTAAAVIAFVLSGFEILGGLLWVLGGSVVDDLEKTWNLGTDLGTIIMLLGLASLLVGGACIWGGVMTLKCKTPVLFAAAGVDIVLNVVSWIVVEGRGGALGIVLSAVILLLLALPASRKF